MGFFGSLVGWDQSMGAVNAVMASHLIELANSSERKRITNEVIKILASVQHRASLELILQDINKQTRAVQMNFVALACDNLGVPPPFPNCFWTRVKNPYRTGSELDENRIAAAVYTIEKQNGIRVNWPGNSVSINFAQMLRPVISHEKTKRPWEFNKHTLVLSNIKAGYYITSAQYTKTGGAVPGFEIHHGPIPWVNDWDVDVVE